MIEYEYIAADLQEQIQEIADTDEFGTLDAKTLYNGIRNSTGTIENLAALYEVPVDLVIEIKDLNKDSKD